jgi:hypothetical protein
LHIGGGNMLVLGFGARAIPGWYDHLHARVGEVRPDLNPPKFILEDLDRRGEKCLSWPDPIFV